MADEKILPRDLVENPEPPTQSLAILDDGTNVFATSIEDIGNRIGAVRSVQAGLGISVDNTDPLNPVVTATEGGGDMFEAIYDPQGISNDAFARENHTGFQAISTITGLQEALDEPIPDGAVTLAKTDGTFATITARDVPELLSGVIAGKTLSYAEGPGNIVVVPGQIVRTAREGFVYAVAASTATGNRIVETAGGVRLTVFYDLTNGVNVGAYGPAADGVTNDGPIIQKALYSGAGRVVLPMGHFGVGQELIVPDGIIFEGVSSGLLTPGYYKTLLKAVSAIARMVYLEGGNYSIVRNFNVDCNSLATRGLQVRNTWGAKVEDIRVNNAINSCVSVVNDGTDNGCYSNTFNRVAVGGAQIGFETNFDAAAVNDIVFSDCTVTDCEQYGFLEFGAAGGRNISYTLCNIEKCGVGIKALSKGVNITHNYFEYNGIDVEVTRPNSGTQFQGGIAEDNTHLGAYDNAPGAPEPKDSLGYSINYAYGFRVANNHLDHYKRGIYVNSGCRDIELKDQFWGNSVETRWDIDDYHDVSVVQGAQRSVGIRTQAAGFTPDPGQVVLAVNNGNSNVGVALDISNPRYAVGMGHEIYTLLTSANTGVVTVSDVSGGNFYGMMAGTYLNNVSSFTIGYRQGAEVYKLNATTWLVQGYAT